MINYVCGFYFDESFDKVVLIRKTKPDYLAGKLNGVGGKVNEGETNRLAMVREFKEETGVDTLICKWKPLCWISTNEYKVEFFYTWGNTDNVITTTEEPVEVKDVHTIDYDKTQYVGNLDWLIPLARYKNKFSNEMITL